MSALAEALIAAQAELPTALGRDAENADVGYRYMTLDKLIAATRPILNAHGLGISQAPTTIERRDTDGHIQLVPGLATRLYHTTAELGRLTPDWRTSIDAEAIEYVMPLYLADKTMQAFGSAITYARRYAWASVLGIAAEEDTDAVPFLSDYIMQNEDGIDYIEHLGGVDWYTEGKRWSELRRRLPHRHIPQTRAIWRGRYIERCPCGAYGPSPWRRSL